MFKRQKHEDERIVAENQKHNSEVLSIIIWGLLIDIFYRSVIVRQDISDFWDISLLFFGSCFYLVIRNSLSGIIAFEGNRKAFITVVPSALVAGVAMTATFWWLDHSLSWGQMAINFAIGTIGFGLVSYLILYISNRRAEKD